MGRIIAAIIIGLALTMATFSFPIEPIEGIIFGMITTIMIIGMWHVLGEPEK